MLTLDSETFIPCRSDDGYLMTVICSGTWAPYKTSLDPVLLWALKNGVTSWKKGILVAETCRSDVVVTAQEAESRKENSKANTEVRKTPKNTEVLAGGDGELGRTE